jgi:hypothetical protein
LKDWFIDSHAQQHEGKYEIQRVENNDIRRPDPYDEQTASGGPITLLSVKLRVSALAVSNWSCLTMEDQRGSSRQ